MRDSLLDESRLSNSYLVLTVGACMIATLGLLSNSAAVIIGAMIVAPLMLPIRGMAFGILEADIRLVRSGAIALVVGSGVAIAMACLLGLLVGLPQYGSEVLARSRPTLLDLGIAIAAGGISGYAKVEPKVSSTLAGTAIAVALMPPVCVVGLGLAQAGLSEFSAFQGSYAYSGLVLSRGALLLYVTNLIGITLSCMVTFWLAGYTPAHKARMPLGYTLLATGILMVPLAASLVELVRQNRLEASLRSALSDTQTIDRVQVVSMETTWISSPPEVRLVVISQEPITPKQVGLVEEFVFQRMRQPFRLIFEIGQLQEVDSDLEEEETEALTD